MAPRSVALSIGMVLVGALPVFAQPVPSFADLPLRVNLPTRDLILAGPRG